MERLFGLSTFDNTDELFDQFFGRPSSFFGNFLLFQKFLEFFVGERQERPQSHRGFRPRTAAKKEKKSAPAPNSKEAQIKLLEQNPNSGHYYKRLGNEHFKNQQYKKAIECYDMAIVLIRFFSSN